MLNFTGLYKSSFTAPAPVMTSKPVVATSTKPVSGDTFDRSPVARGGISDERAAGSITRANQILGYIQADLEGTELPPFRIREAKTWANVMREVAQTPGRPAALRQEAEATAEKLSNAIVQGEAKVAKADARATGSVTKGNEILGFLRSDIQSGEIPGFRIDEAKGWHNELRQVSKNATHPAALRQDADTTANNLADAIAQAERKLAMNEEKAAVQATAPRAEASAPASRFSREEVQRDLTYGGRAAQDLRSTVDGAEQGRRIHLGQYGHAEAYAGRLSFYLEDAGLPADLRGQVEALLGSIKIDLARGRGFASRGSAAVRQADAAREADQARMEARVRLMRMSRI